MPSWKPQNIKVGLTIIDKFNKGFGLQSNWDSDITNLDALLTKGIANGFANLLETSFYTQGTPLDKTTAEYIGNDIKTTIVVISGMYKDYEFMDHALKNAQQVYIVADEDDKAHINKLNLQSKNYFILNSLDELNLHQAIQNTTNNSSVVDIDISPNPGETILTAFIVDPNGIIQNLPVQNNKIVTKFTPSMNGKYSVKYTYTTNNNIPNTSQSQNNVIRNNQGQQQNQQVQQNNNQNQNNQNNQQVNATVQHQQPQTDKNAKAEVYIVGIDEDGKELYRDLVSNSLKVGSQITISPKEIFGYKPEQSGSIQYTINQQLEIYTYKYSSKKGNIVVRHVDLNGVLLSEVIVKKNEKFGTEWTYTPPKEFKDKGLILSSEYKDEGLISGTISTELFEYVFKYVNKDDSKNEKSNEDVIVSKDTNKSKGMHIIIATVVLSVLIGLGIVLLLNWQKITSKKNKNIHEESSISDDSDEDY